MSKKQPAKKSPGRRISLRRLVDQAVDLGYRKPFVATKQDVEMIWDALNRAIFRGVLVKPEKFIMVYDEDWPYWGECEGLQRGHRYGPHYTKAIRLHKYWPNAKKFINTLAHEMVHQYEWEQQGTMSHGKTFFAWEERLREYGIPLGVYP